MRLARGRRVLVSSLAIALLVPALPLAMPALGATPAAADEQLEAALLTASDLPAGLTTDGSDDGSRFETAVTAYQASGGLGVREQTWSASSPTPIYRLFDFRMLFPSPEQAQAYLDAAEPLLSEVAVSGLKLVNDNVTIGDGYRHYALQTIANEQPVALQNILFRVGPMVAKVFVGGFGTSDEDVLGLARTAAARMATALAGTGASPAPSAAGESPAPSAAGESPAPSATGASPAPSATGASPAPSATGEGPTPSDADGAIRQWASSARARTAYGRDSWSAQQAAGAPNSLAYGDNGTAWAPAREDGPPDWLDLRYDQAVLPSALNVYESDGSGFVTKVEAYHTAAGTWVTLWEGSDPTPSGAVGTFSPPLAASDIAVDRIRVTIDPSVPDWNEIDAVELVGVPPS